MRSGVVHCECGQELHFQTINTEISCVQCYAKINVASFEDVEEKVEPTEGE